MQTLALVLLSLYAAAVTVVGVLLLRLGERNEARLKARLVVAEQRADRVTRTSTRDQATALESVRRVHDLEREVDRQRADARALIGEVDALRSALADATADQPADPLVVQLLREQVARLDAERRELLARLLDGAPRRDDQSAWVPVPPQGGDEFEEPYQSNGVIYQSDGLMPNAMSLDDAVDVVGRLEAIQARYAAQGVPIEEVPGQVPAPAPPAAMTEAELAEGV